MTYVLTVRVPRSDAQAIVEFARSTGRSEVDLVRSEMRKYLNEDIGELVEGGWAERPGEGAMRMSLDIDQGMGSALRGVAAVFGKTEQDVARTIVHLIANRSISQHRLEFA
jgi:hypothetical protein